MAATVASRHSSKSANCFSTTETHTHTIQCMHTYLFLVDLGRWCVVIIINIIDSSSSSRGHVATLSTSSRLLLTKTGLGLRMHTVQLFKYNYHSRKKSIFLPVFISGCCCRSSSLSSLYIPVFFDFFFFFFFVVAFRKKLRYVLGCLFEISIH